MQKVFALAVIGAALVEAKRGKKNSSVSDPNEELEFLQYASETGKHYKSVEEMEKRKANWKKAKGRIETLKQKNKKATFKVNQFSDMDDSELSSFLGFATITEDDMQDGAARRLADEDNLAGAGRNLSDYGNIDWSTSGHMTPVKNQGQCGSCWAFSATSVLEAMVSIEKTKLAGGELVEPYRLSESQAVDCFSPDGCQGGHYYNYWRYSGSYGSMRSLDYQYQAAKGTCRHDPSKADTKVQTVYWYQPTSTVAQIRAMLDLGPVSIAVNVPEMLENPWYEYAGGVIEATADCSGNQNHAVALVGYEDGGVDGVPTWKVQNSWSEQWGEEGFIRLEVTEGFGTCNMNNWVMGVRPIV